MERHQHHEQQGKAAKETMPTQGSKAGRDKEAQKGGAKAEAEWRSRAGARLNGDQKRGPSTSARTGHGQVVRPGSQGARGSEGPKRDQGDGKVVFAQLRAYLLSDAAAAYITPLMVKLAKLAAERRYQAYCASLSNDEVAERSEEERRERWADGISEEMYQRYAGLESYWDLSDEVHVRRLKVLMHEWIIATKLPQQEVEDRLRVMKMEDPRCGREASTPDRAMPSSYKGAVTQGTHPRGARGLTEEQRRLTELCLQPAKVLTQLRQRTEDEDAALLMILNQEIEVPAPPRFLVQSMDARAIARFTDLFLGIEYPLYAHLAPGQWFGENLPKQEIFTLIHGGLEAAPLQKQEVAEFKESLSRITLDMDTRVLTVTFKGRKTAQRWEHWKVPMAGKLLQLIDYEQQREVARSTHEIVQLDYYAFTAEVKRGKVTSTDLHWILDKMMGLQVQSMVHPETDRGGINDKRWTLLLKGAGCPRKLRNIAILKTGEVELLIWHHTIHVSRPCSTCYSPNHQSRYCRETSGAMEARRKGYTWRINGTTPSCRGTGGRDYRPVDPPKTLAQMMELLQGPGTDGSTAQENKPETPVKERSSEGAGPRQDGGGSGTAPVLPKEWEQPRRASSDARGPSPQTRMREQANAGDTPGECLREEGGQDRGGGCPADGRQETPPQEGIGRSKADPPEVGSRKDSGEGRQQQLDGTADIDDDMGAAEEAQLSAGEEERRGRRLFDDTAPNETGQGQTEGRRILHARKAGGGSSPSPSRREAKQGAPVGAPTRVNREDVRRPRRLSSSPKRRAKEEWQEGRSITTEGADDKPSRSGATGQSRSLSPVKRVRGGSGREGRLATQKFMYQFLQIPPFGELMGAQDAQDQTQGQGTESMEVEGAQAAPTPAETDEEECKVVKVTTPTDTGAPLEKWLKILGGTVADVAANGQCGWLAFYAALYNVTAGLMGPVPEVAEAANGLKKQVINGLLANLDTELALHPQELKAEAMLLGTRGSGVNNMAEVMGTLAEHYAAQRKRSVKAHVPMHYWVRPTHLKAMAIHAREALHVLDVRDQGLTRLQVYAYRDTKMANGETVETGTVTPVDTQVAMTMLGEMVLNGILPPVMILRWRETGNHFQAVAYDRLKYEQYAANLPALAGARNCIRERAGQVSLDAVPYDTAKNTKAAAQFLKTVRKAIKAGKAESPTVTDLTRHPSQEATLEPGGEPVPPSGQGDTLGAQGEMNQDGEVPEDRRGDQERVGAQVHIEQDMQGPQEAAGEAQEGDRE